VTTAQTTTTPSHPFEPRFPTLVATGLFSLWIFVLSLPLWTGRFLGGIVSDQYHSGYAFRHWLAEEWKRTGHIPLWNPDLFAGLPFVGAMHGDIFYPTSWLRLVLPTGLAMGLGFVVHYVLAGLFLYLLLRALKVSWIGCVTGGAAYQLSGVIGSYVAPGHDGKLFVTALLPLVLLGLVRGIRERRIQGFGIVALGVGLALLSPHAQMTYYLLIAAGLFAMYLTFGEPDDAPMARRLAGLGWSLGAVVLGFGIGAIQLMPFFAYLPYSPRADTYFGYEGATSFAIPWVHVPEFLFPNFTGTTQAGTYWGPNGFGLKLHSEYLGLGALALAVAGAGDRERRRLVLWLGGIGLLFLLIGLGGSTPFYRLWWAVMPYVKKTRAPGMALYVVCLVVSVLAALGAQRVERGRARGLVVPWLAIGAVIAALGLTGVLGALARSLAEGVQAAQGRETVGAAVVGQPAIRIGALWGGVALMALGGAAWLLGEKRVPRWGLIAVPLIVGADLWLNARPFWGYSEPPTEGLYGGDEITRALQAAREPARVMDYSDTEVAVYPGASLMAFHVPQLLGHQPMHPHTYSELLGGRNRWTYLFLSRRLWDLFAVQYVLLPSGLDLGSQLPAYQDLAVDFDTLLARVTTSRGAPADLLVRREPARYARLVPGAIKATDEQAIPTVADPRSRLDFDRLVVLAPDAPFEPDSIADMPEPLEARVTVEEWEPGRMRLTIEPPAPTKAYVTVAENFSPGWEATVDGTPAVVTRGNVTLITVPVPAGAREVHLRYRAPAYAAGRAVTFVSLLVALAACLGPSLARRRRRA
jgi:Bacterial membrane protein YfhO